MASDLKGAFLGTNGALGTLAVGFTLENTSTVPCHTYGWPGVQLQSASGAALSASATRTSSDPIGATPASKLVVSPGAKVSFRMLLAAVQSSAASSCHTVAALQIIAPDDTATLSVAIPGGVPVCGPVSVSPLMAGTSAWPAP